MALNNIQSSISFESISDRHTHPYDGLFSRTTWANQHQKSQINLDFNEARDDGVAMASAGPYAT